MAVLKSNHKEFIVRELACYKRPQEVLETFQSEFPGVELSNKQVSYYNPKNNSGQKLAEKWVDLYQKVQEEFREGIIEIPLSLKQKRIEELSDIYYKLKDAKNLMGAVQILKQIREEVESIPDPSDEEKDRTSYYTQIINHMVDSLR